MTELHYADSTFVARLSDELYDLIADVTRMGEWSPICKACWWDEGAGPTVGSWFTGSNELGDRIWETRCQVVAAERGREFAWTVGQSVVRWGYTFEPAAGGTTLTESWEFPSSGQVFFGERFGVEAETEIASRYRLAQEGIPQTLAAIKRSAEA